MKSTTLKFGFLFITVATIFSSCTKDKCSTTYTYKAYEPVYMDYDEFRSSVASEDPRSLENPGKIYLFGGYLFINEVNKGVHVIDNSDPSNPGNKAFINIPGNIDIAVKSGILYADSYSDLVAIDISDPLNATETKRLEDIFPQRYYSGYSVDPEKGVIVDWKETDRTETYEVDCGGDDPYYNYPYYVEYDNATGGPILFNSVAGANSNSTTTINPTGVGGSMARFTVTNRYLYAIDNTDLNLIDISDATSPTVWNKVSIGFNIETIFPYGQHLFIGSQTGMHIYDISSPASPQPVTTYEHIRSCDPVVVEGDYAYVTLRSGTPCQGYTNQLDVVDISDMYNPSLVKSYDMFNPHGLGIDNGTLFICDGDAGLKVFNASDPMTIDQKLLGHFGDIHTYDVIPYNNILIMTGDDGISEYDYSDPQNIVQISQIPVN